MARPSAGDGRRRDVRGTPGRLALLLALAALAVAGCDDPAVSEPVPSPTTTPVPPPHAWTPPARDWSAVPGILGPDGQAVAVSEVGAGEPSGTVPVEVVRTHRYRPEGDDIVRVLDLRPDGSAVVALVRLDDFDGGTLELLAPARLALWSEAGLVPLGSTEGLVPGDPYREAAVAAATDTAVVWLETSLTGVGEPRWRFFRASPDAGAAPALLVRSEDASAGAGGRPLLDASGPAVVGDRLVWASSHTAAGDAVGSAVLSVPLDGGEVRVEAEGAALPAATDAGLAVLRLPAGGGAGGPTGIDLLAPGGEARPLVRFPGPAAAGGHVPTLVADGTLVAWVLDHHLYVTTVDGGEVQRVRTPGPVDPYGVVVCDGRVVWTPEHEEDAWPTAAYVLDPATGQVSVLGTGPHAAGVTCGGPYLSWVQVEPTTDEVSVVVGRWTD